MKSRTRNTLIALATIAALAFGASAFGSSTTSAGKWPKQLSVNV